MTVVELLVSIIIVGIFFTVVARIASKSKDVGSPPPRKPGSFWGG